MKWKKLWTQYGSIRNRLSMAMVLMLIVMIGVNFFIFGQINTAVSRIDAVFSSNVTVNQLADTLNLLQESIFEYLNTKSSQALENYYRYEVDYQELLTDLNDQYSDSEIRMLEKNIRNMSESYLQQADQTVSAKRGRNVEKYKESYERGSRLYEYINTYIYRLNNLRFRQNSTNYQKLLETMNQLEIFSLLILAALFLIAMLLTALLIKDMLQPLQTLTQAAREVAAGNLQIEELTVIHEDEVGIVTASFNQMLSGIRESIRQLRESLEKEAQLKEDQLSMEAHLKEAQLKFLQAQINPHFLFNSLNAAAQLAMLEDAERTSVFLEKMADFFRYNVRKTSDNATLLEELESADNYIYILNVRFSGDICYEKQIDDNLENISMPSMILQPIVENAVQHGIHDCLDRGWIHLRVRQMTDEICIIVEDNGAGMTAERIAEIFSMETQNRKNTKDSTGIALENVIHRLEFFYNEKNLLEIESDGPGQGSRITLHLPRE